MFGLVHLDSELMMMGFLDHRSQTGQHSGAAAVTTHVRNVFKCFFNLNNEGTVFKYASTCFVGYSSMVRSQDIVFCEPQLYLESSAF